MTDVTHKAVLHLWDKFSQSIIVPVENMPELKRRLHMSLAYTEIIGSLTYDHYDVLGVL